MRCLANFHHKNFRTFFFNSLDHIWLCKEQNKDNQSKSVNQTTGKSVSPLYLYNTEGKI